MTSSWISSWFPSGRSGSRNEPSPATVTTELTMFKSLCELLKKKNKLYLAMGYNNSTGAVLHNQTVIAFIAHWRVCHMACCPLQTKSKFNSLIEPLFRELSLLKVEHIFQIQCLQFYYNVINERTPKLFSKMFTSKSRMHSHETR